MIKTLIEKYLSGYRASAILDVGPGYADFSRFSARITGATAITFLDCDASVLKYQLEEGKKSGFVVESLSISLDPEAISSISGKFDIIHCQEVLEHLIDGAEVLRALGKLLSHSGKLIITVPTKRSERWLKFLNPSYMKNEPHGHVNEFDKEALTTVVESAGLEIRALIPTQPHYFVAHSWLVATRMKIEGSTGKVNTGGIRKAVFDLLTKYCLKFFASTAPHFWSAVLPRNYFVIASPKLHANTH
jgi:SAM-dependent methyltransferase